MAKEKNALKEFTESQLTAEIERLRREYFSLKLAVVTSPAKDVRQFRKLRKDIARALTYLTQKQQMKVQKAQ